MSQEGLNERPRRNARPTPPDDCPNCEATALVTRTILEHLPCGHTYFRDAHEIDVCTKCNATLTTDAVAYRGTVFACLSCRHVFDATARDGDE